MPNTRPLRVFISYARPDIETVRKLYARLRKEKWLDLWFDEENLLPGQNWDLEIKKALRETDAVIVCLSATSVSKEGYVQKEIKTALDILDEKPDGAIYLIPLRLDDCKTPERLKKLHWVDYFNNNHEGKLLAALKARAKSLDLQIPAELPPTRKLEIEPAKYTPGGRPVYTFGGMEFVKVLANDFWMGADDLDDDEKPQHLVYQLNYDFYIGRFTVTNLQYSMFTRELGKPVVFAKEKANHPVVEISWHDAQNYIAWMNKKYGGELPAGLRFRLPSEAEWERAARGTQGNEYPWGNTFDKNRCNSEENGINDTTPVGKYSPQGDSPEGCADMLGNVLEWTRSLWGADDDNPAFKYPYRFDDGREDENADDEIARILRGGAFFGTGERLYCARRYRYYPYVDEIDPGFRVAMSPSPA